MEYPKWYTNWLDKAFDEEEEKEIRDLVENN